MGLFSKKEIKQWKFAEIQNIEEANFNNILERFHKIGVKGLVKENIQNSLDGRLAGSSLPVVVKIKTGDIESKYIPGANEVIDHIKCLVGRNSYTREAISDMLKKIDKDIVRYISFEDINTKGLKGAKNGQSYAKDDTWGIYAYMKGVHSEESDSEVETTRGGSYGVGKIASNSASSLHMMYFANCDENGEKHLGGSVQLIEHEYNGKSYRSTGYFTDQREEHGKYKFYPYINNFHEVFEKNTRGLKIVIPYLKEDFDDEKEIIRSVCDSFFIAILKNRLEVHINEHIIDANSIEKYVNNPEYYEQEISNMKKIFTPLYVNTYKNQEPREISVSNGVKDYKFKLYFQYNEEITKGRVAIVRTIGMKIEDFSVKNNATKPYNAVLIGGVEEDGYLKSLENESHTEISFEHIRDSDMRKQAKKFISKLSSEISNIIDEVMNERNPVDGALDTDDLLYLVESKFKQDLAQSYETVKIKNNDKLVKLKASIPDKKKPGDRKGPIEPKQSGIKRHRKPKIEDMENESIEILDSYKVEPHIVNRLILNDNEYLKLDFKEEKEVNKKGLCNILLRIVDGMGVEYENEFNIENNYESIIDENTGMKLPIINNGISKVSISKGIVKLKLKLKSNFNKALKFIYYVEV